METSVNLIVIMIISGIVFISSMFSLYYGIKMDSVKLDKRNKITGRYAENKIGRRVTLAPKYSENNFLRKLKKW